MATLLTPDEILSKVKGSGQNTQPKLPNPDQLLTQVAPKAPGLFSTLGPVVKSGIQSFGTKLGSDLSKLGSDIIRKPVQTLGELPGVIKSAGKGLFELNKQLVQAPLRTSTEAGLSVIQAVTGKDSDQELTPEAAAIYGEPKLETFQTKLKKGSTLVKQLGGTLKEQKYVPPLGIAIGSILDFYAGGEGAPALKKLAQETSETAVKDIIRKEIKNIPEEYLPQLSKDIAKLGNEGQIKTLLESAAIPPPSVIHNAVTAATKTVDKGFEGFTDLSTKTLEKLRGRTKVSKQFIEDLTNAPDLKQPERDAIRAALEGQQEQVNVKEFADKVKSDLLPLKEFEPDAKYESVSLPKELRGEVQDYKERVYESPIKTEAGNVHYADYGAKAGEIPLGTPQNYFAHTRVEDLPNNTRRVIEVQSDLFQRGRLDREMPQMLADFEGRLTDDEMHDLRSLSAMKANRKLKDPSPVVDAEIDAINKELKPLQDKMAAIEAARKIDVSKLEPYRNTWHERVIREEVKKAAEDGKPILQFPTGETAMKIEGLGGRASRWIETGAGPQGYGQNLTIENLKPGIVIHQDGINKWVITDVLEDGKFKAVQKAVVDRYERSGISKEKALEQIRKEGSTLETFDISNKVDTNNPIYKFYEKEVGKYLKNKYGATQTVDKQGVSWWQVNVPNALAKAPVEAFGATAGFGVDDKGNIVFDPKKAALGVLGVGALKHEGFRAFTKEFFEKIAKETDAEEIRTALVDFGIKSDKAFTMAKVLQGVDDVADVERILRTDVSRMNLKEDVAAVKSEIEALKEAIDTHPAKAIEKYANKRTGEIPEALGKKGTSIFGQYGDDIANEAGFDTSEEARAAYQELQDFRKQLAQLEDQARAVRTNRRIDVRAADDAAALQRFMVAEEKKTIKQTEQATRLAERKRAFDEGLRTVAKEQEYKRKFAEAVQTAKRNILGEKEGLYKKLQQALYPLKGVNQDTQSIYRNWKEKLLVGKVLADKEIEKLKIPNVGGWQTILNYQAGMKSDLNDKIKNIFDDLFTEARNRGLDFRYRENYLPQVYKESREDVKQAMAKYLVDQKVNPQMVQDYLDEVKEIPMELVHRLKLNPDFIKARTFPDYKTAMEYGLNPKYSNPAQLVAYYREQMETALANKEFLDNLVTRAHLLPADIAPNHWEAVNLPFSPKGYYAEPSMARLLNGTFRNEDRLPFGATLAKFTGAVSRRMQEIALSGGVPKTDINFFSIGQLVKEMTAGNLKAVLPFVRANFDEASVNFFKKNEKYLTMMADAGLNLGDHVGSYGRAFENIVAKKKLTERVGYTFDDLFNDKTFASFLPQLHVQTFKDVLEHGVKQGMTEQQASRFAADVVRKSFGILEDFGRTKTVEDTLSSLFFAPKFREGIINTLYNTGKSITTEFKNPIYYRNRRLAAGMALTYGLYNALNYKLNGNFMWDNEPNRQFALKIPRDNGEVIYLEFMPSFLAFARNMASGAVAAVSGSTSDALQKFGSVFSMPVKTTSEVLANKDYFGNEIYKETDTRWQATKKVAKYLFLSVTHPYVKEVINQIYDTKPLYQSIITALELPLKFSSLEKISKQQFYDALDKQKLLRARAVEKVQPIYEQVQTLIDQGKEEEARTIVEGLSDEDYALYKSIRTADKRKTTQQNESIIYSLVAEVRRLKEEGRLDEAQAKIDALTDDEYKAYTLAKKRTE